MTGRLGTLLRNGSAALAHRNYRLYFSGRVISLVGTWIQRIAMPWLLLELGGSPVEVGLLAAAEFAPLSILTPIMGVLADRIDRRRALAVAEGFAMLQAVALWALVVTGRIEVWHLFVLALLLGVANSAQRPIQQAFAADLVPRAALLNAVGLNSVSLNLARFVGPPIGGLLIAAIGVGPTFLVNGLSHVAVLVGLWLIDDERVGREAAPRPSGTIMAGLREGFGFVRRTPVVLWSLVLLGGVAVFAMNLNILLPIYAREVLSLDAAGFGLLYGVFGLGALAGALTITAAGRAAAVPTMVGAAVVFSATVILLGLTALGPLAGGLAFVAGATSLLLSNTVNATLVWSASPAMRGRALSIYVMVFTGSVPSGGIVAGLLAEHLGVGAALVIGGLAGLAFAVGAWTRLRRDPAAATIFREPAAASAGEPVAAGAVPGGDRPGG